jgi:3-methyladenine DNA glycosylase AlkD
MYDAVWVSPTLEVCRALIDDRDDMVVKALSWALRELANRNGARHGQLQL